MFVCYIYVFILCTHYTPIFLCLFETIFISKAIRDYNLSTHAGFFFFFSLELVEVCTSIVEHSTNKFISTLRININLKRRKDFLP